MYTNKLQLLLLFILFYFFDSQQNVFSRFQLKTNWGEKNVFIIIYHNWLLRQQYMSTAVKL